MRLFLLFTEASAVTETGLISQDTYFSDICQIDWYFMHGISQKLLAAPFNESYFQMVFAYYKEFKCFTTVQYKYMLPESCMCPQML